VASERLFMRSILDQQLDTYMEATNVAATLSSTTDDAERRKAIDAFWKLYWGPMVMFESQAVTDRMMAIGHCLDHPSVCSDSARHSRSLALASALKNEYLEVSSLSTADYAKRGHNYTTLQR
jgi:hypothetical protein